MAPMTAKRTTTPPPAPPPLRRAPPRPAPAPSADGAVVIPPRVNAVDRSNIDPPSQRDRHIAAINTDGRMTWQAVTGYGKRSLVETAIGRYKAIIGGRLRARSFDAQQTEVAIGCVVLNRMPACARPKS